VARVTQERGILTKWPGTSPGMQSEVRAYGPTSPSIFEGDDGSASPCSLERVLRLPEKPVKRTSRRGQTIDRSPVSGLQESGKVYGYSKLYEDVLDQGKMCCSNRVVRLISLLG
jgi:hypothetical protein